VRTELSSDRGSVVLSAVLEHKPQAGGGERGREKATFYFSSAKGLQFGRGWQDTRAFDYKRKKKKEGKRKRRGIVSALGS